MAEKIVGIVPHRTNDFQLNDLATIIFTVGGIDITTNLQPARDTTFSSPQFSEFFDLESIPEGGVTRTFTPLEPIELNYDAANPKYFAKFGSLLELVRVSLETINLSYPAAIRSLTQVRGIVGNNVLNASYFPFEDSTKFLANVSFFSNPFDIYYLDNPQFQYDDERINPIRNLTQNFEKYEVVVDGVGYPILEYVPAQRTSNDFLRLKIKGKPFEIGNNSKEFYIKPIESEINSFYDSLDDFESYLLNRNADFTAFFNDTYETDGDTVIDYILKIQFPTLDEYNIDMISTSFDVYKGDLNDFAERFDDTEGNLLMRHMVPENVQSVTMENMESDMGVSGKINKVLTVYGREWDKINRYIENIKFFNNVTYNKRDNLPDNLLKDFANTLGWEVEFPEEIDEQVWRILVVNSWWIWKSKGTRKAIEFIFDFLSIPKEIYDFNEYILRARNPVDVELVNLYYSLIGGEIDINTLPIDSEGYPTFLPDTDNEYFQIFGTADRGFSYFAKYANLLPFDFSGGSIIATGESVSSETLFEQDFNGSGNTLGYSIVDDNLSDNFCYDSSGSTIGDPYPETILDICGCPLPISDKTLEVCIASVDLNTGCTTIIVDAWYECISKDEAELFVNVLGGTPPYQMTGGMSGDIVSTGETLQIQATDSNGCQSDIYEITIECVDPCLSVDIDVTIGFVCEVDEFGQNTGQATVSLTILGGEAPYSIDGVQDGDVVNHDEIVTVTVTDANGCSSGLVGKLIDCPPPDVVACTPITLNSTLETTNSEPQDRTAKVNVTYDLIGIPSGVFVSGVTLTSKGSGGDSVYVVGGTAVTNFTTRNGADTIELDFYPEELPSSITMDISIEILLSNGCTYTENNYIMSVNPRQLGNADFYDAILNP